MVNRASRRKAEVRQTKTAEQSKRPIPMSYYQPTYSPYGYMDHQLPEKMRVPYILTRYRFPGLSAEQCCESLFQPHNETVNIWSHIIALTFFLMRHSHLIKEHNSLEDPLVYPLFCCAIGIILMLLISICTHTFNSMSYYTYHVCYFCDYAAISVCTFTTAQALYFYSRPLISSWSIFNSPIAFLSFSVLNSSLSTFTCCAVLVRRPWYHAFVRTSAYLSLGLFTVLPYVGRLAICSYRSAPECTTSSYPHFKYYCLYLAIAGFTYANRIPERLFPKMFDLLGQSHHILHVLSALAVSEVFTAVQLDMKARKKSLIDVPLSWAELCSVFSVIAVILNTGIVFWFSKSLYTRLTKERPKK